MCGYRRHFLTITVVSLFGLAFGAHAGTLAAAQEQRAAIDETVRDKLWIFTVVAGADDEYLKKGGFTQKSRMTPAEGAFYLDVPNLMMIRWNGKPAFPLDQYAIPFRPLKRVVWSLVDSSGKTKDADRRATIEFAARCPNVTGFIMDDFFFIKPPKGRVAHLSLDELKDLRKEVVIEQKRRDLYVVVYQRTLNPAIKPYLELCDKITYWTWDANNLANIEKDFARLEKLAPNRPKLLGCYFWDFHNDRPVPLELMQKQCRLGLEWLRQGRIEGIIFLANSVADLDLPSVEWTRKWIAEAGGQPLLKN